MVKVSVAYKKKSCYLRVSKGGKTKYRVLFPISKSHFDAEKERVKNHLLSENYNTLISTKKLEIQKRALDFECNGEEYTLEDLFTTKEQSRSLYQTIVTYANNKYRDGSSYQVRETYMVLAEKIKGYQDVNIESINLQYLKGFISYLGNQKQIRSKATISKHFKLLKSVLKAFDIAPIGMSQIKIKVSKTRKTKLTIEEFQKIEGYDNGDHNLTRDVFCSLVYLGGIRIGDLLTLRSSDIINGRIVFNERKTGKSKSIIIIPRMQEIIDRYHDSNGYLLPVMKIGIEKRERSAASYVSHMKSKVALLNMSLKVIASELGIRKNLSTHVARHTFATWASHEGIELNLISKMLNHSNIEITKGYIDELNRQNDIDAAMLSILN